MNPYQSTGSAGGLLRYEGANTMDYLQTLFATSKATGNSIIIKGWDSTPEFSNNWGGHIRNVYFWAVENGKELKFHWIGDYGEVLYSNGCTKEGKSTAYDRSL